MCTDDIHKELYETFLYGFSVTVNGIQAIYDGLCPIDKLKEKWRERKYYSDDEFNQWINDCKKRGTITEPKEGYLKVDSKRIEELYETDDEWEWD